MAEKTKEKPQLTGAFELFNISSKLVQSNIGTFAIIYLLPLLINVSTAHHNWRSDGGTRDFTSLGGLSGLPNYALGAFVGLGIVFAIIAFAVWLIINAMTIGLQLEVANSKKPKLDDLWPYAKKYWLKLFVLSILIAIFVVAGLLLFIIPGLIMIRRYFLAPYILVDQDTGIWEAMAESAAMSKPHSGYIWSIIGVEVLIGLPSVIPFVGWAISFALSVLYSVAPALRYQELKKLET